MGERHEDGYNKVVEIGFYQAPPHASYAWFRCAVADGVSLFA